jgi:cyclic pyranopterin phosphate synthase
MSGAPRPTHLDDQGRAHMVDVGAKAVTRRVAVAEGTILMRAEVRDALFAGTLPKGDAVAVARVAGILAAKRTADLIPLCHPVAVTHSAIDIEPQEAPSGVLVRATVQVDERTGVEMEALTAATITLLTLYDMAKGMQKDLRITDVRLRRKTGGRSGDLELP